MYADDYFEKTCPKNAWSTVSSKAASQDDGGDLVQSMNTSRTALSRGNRNQALLLAPPDPKLPNFFRISYQKLQWTRSGWSS